MTTVSSDYHHSPNPSERRVSRFSIVNCAYCRVGKQHLVDERLHARLFFLFLVLLFFQIRHPFMSGLLFALVLLFIGLRYVAGKCNLFATINLKVPLMTSSRLTDRGVSPLLFLALTSIPRSINHLIKRALATAERHAICKQVLPSLFVLLMLIDAFLPS